jgi:large subunit ribosomal protein L24
MKTNLRRDDQVVVDVGRSKGKRGRILHIFPDKNRALVEGANIITKATRPNPRINQPGGFVKKESSIHISNLLFFCPTCDKGVRIKKVKGEDGKIKRMCRKCNNPLDKGGK